MKNIYVIGFEIMATIFSNKWFSSVFENSCDVFNNERLHLFKNTTIRYVYLGSRKKNKK